MSKVSARNALELAGYPLQANHGDLDYFCDNALQLEYEDDCVRFIGISEHQEISCTFEDTDVFDVTASELFMLIAVQESAVPLVEPGETCFFPEQGINLWEADEQYDRKGNYERKIYAQFGMEKPADA